MPGIGMGGIYKTKKRNNLKINIFLNICYTILCIWYIRIFVYFIYIYISNFSKILFYPLCIFTHWMGLYIYIYIYKGVYKGVYVYRSATVESATGPISKCHCFSLLCLSPRGLKHGFPNHRKYSVMLMDAHSVIYDRGMAPVFT